MERPRFSVVIPVFNRAEVVRRALESVLAQNFPDLEVIVVDDGSTDDTLARLREIDDRRLRTVGQERAGAAAARNRGAALALGDFLTFLDSDDEALPQWLSHFEQLIRSEDAALVSCSLSEGDPTGPLRKVMRPRPHPLFATEALFLAGGYAVRRSLFEAAGGFSVDQRAGQHTELALRILPLLIEGGCRSATTPAPLVVRHVHGKDRIRGDDRAVFEGGRRLLEVHGQHYARHPERFAAQAASTGVRAVRIGEFGEARRHLWLAVRARPLKPKGWARLAAVLLPPVATRLWPGRGGTG